MMWHPWDVTCPVCGAHPGEACRTVPIGDDPARRLVHAARTEDEGARRE